MFTLNCKGRLLTINQPIVMGILNITPDSFYEGSRISNTEQALQCAEKMLELGAMILDVGGQSTRPGATLLKAEEELRRVIPVIEKIANRFPSSFISIDTFYASVAKEAVAAGASIVNDISGASLDPQMISTIPNLNVPYVLMHMRGTPSTMNKLTQYENISRDLLDFFINKIAELNKAGIHDIIVDPGIGFAKNAEQNFELIKHLEIFRMLAKPILVGLSRKSFIYRTLNVPIEESMNGTTALHMLSLEKGAAILRVHDVKEAIEVIRLWNACNT
jgi:dihydropteroate synthase